MPHRPPAAHILSYAETLAGGGVERALLRLARGWVAAGRRVTLVVGDATGPLAAEVPDGVALVPAGGRWPRALLRLPGHVRALAPDILFCAGNHYTGLAALTRWRLGRASPPTVAKMSNALRRRDHGALLAAANRRWLRLHPRFVDHFAAMTPATAADTLRATGVAAERLSVIPNPPVLPLPGASHLPLPAGRFILGVGRLEPQKRWDRLIAALPLVADRAVALVLLGEGSLRPALEAQAAALGLGARVHLPGHAADPLPALARAAAVALTSDFEGVPGVLREALSVGTPVVSTASSSAIGEIVTGPALGTVVPLDDAGALASALDHWLDLRTPRPAPVPQPGADSAARYLDLFDRLVAARRGG